MAQTNYTPQQWAQAIIAKFNHTYPKHMTGTGGATLMPIQIRQIAEAVGYSPKLALQMSQITKGESGMMPGIQQTDPGDGNVGYGLTQVTPHAWGPEGVAHMNQLGGIAAMFNPVKNMMMAKWLSDQAAKGGGNPLSPWYGTRYLNRNPGPVHSVLGLPSGAVQPVAQATAGTSPAHTGATPATGKTTTRTVTTDPNQAARGAAIRSFLFDKSIQPVDFASQVSALQPVTTTVKTTAPASNPNPQVKPQTSSVMPSSTPSAKGVVNFGGKQVAAWIAPILTYAKAHGWTGTVSSGYRSFAQQKAIYDSGVRPAAVPGTSNHEGSQFPRGAVDVTNAAQLSQILQGTKYAGQLVWAGSKDPVHFSHPHNGSY